MNTRSQHGFTLLELMTAVAVLGILLGLGVPSFTQMIRNNRVVANTNELVVALSAARSEAVKRGLPVTVCARSGPTSDVCRTGTASNWGSGWLVFVDPAGTAGVVDAGDEIVQRFDAASAGVTVLSNNRPWVRFAATGLPPSGAVDTTFTIKHVECVDNNRRTVKITATGRLHTNKGACS
jgi:prepilin-type N-terminal cleavage/methylation domain-containing protein